VLLVEAGGDPHPLTYIPYATPALINQPHIDWHYKSEPLENCGFAVVDQVLNHLFKRLLPIVKSHRKRYYAWIW